MFNEKIVKSCNKFDHFKHRMKLINEGEPTKPLQKYKILEKEIPSLDFDEILCTQLNDDELQQIAEDVNYFIPNKKVKEKITIFSTGKMETQARGEAINILAKINVNAIK